MGVHTPELEAERQRGNVEAHVRELGLDWPHLIDNDYRYWNALENQYWPVVYLVDRCGTIRTRVIGEIHQGQYSGRRTEAAIEQLLAESPDCLGR